EEKFSHNRAQTNSFPLVCTLSSTDTAIYSNSSKQQSHNVSSLLIENMNIADDLYIDSITGETLSLTECVKMDLVDFAFICDDGNTYHLREFIEENNLIRLPGMMPEMSLAQVVESILENNGTVTIINKQTNREHQIRIDDSSC